MTALEQYSRLEATGLWREAPDAQRRDVLVSLGDATLMISTLSEVALAHWSLPAVARLNPGRRPALYSPRRGHRGAAGNRRSRHDHGDRNRARRDRPQTAPSGAVAVLDRGGARRRHAGAGGLLVAGRADAGRPSPFCPRPAAQRSAPASCRRSGDWPDRSCTNPRGSTALNRLARRTFGEGAPRVALLPSSVPETLALPGGILVANAGLVEDHETPEVLAG